MRADTEGKWLFSVDVTSVVHTVRVGAKSDVWVCWYEWRWVERRIDGGGVPLWFYHSASLSSHPETPLSSPSLFLPFKQTHTNTNTHLNTIHQAMHLCQAIEFLLDMNPGSDKWGVALCIHRINCMHLSWLIPLISSSGLMDPQLSDFHR